MDYTRHVLVGDVVEATVYINGPRNARQRDLESWSLESLRNQEDVHANARLAAELSRDLRQWEITQVFSPHIEANRLIVYPLALTSHIRMKNVVLHRNSAHPADGLFLGKNEAFMVSAPECATILASAGEHFIVAHAGYDSLIDRGAVTGELAREHFSIVDAIIDAFECLSVKDELAMMMLFSAPAREFECSEDHPIYGTYNRAVVELVEERWPSGILREDGKAFLDLEQIFMEQARQAGLRQVSTLFPLAEFPWLSNIDDSGEELDRQRLIVIKRET